MSLCIPYTVMEPIAPKLSARSWFMTSRKKQSPAARGALRGQVERVRLPVSVVLGAATVTVGELLNLQVGDVVTLETAAKQDLDILVAGEPKFQGRPGVIRRRLGIKITNVIAEAPAIETSPESQEEEEESYVS